MNLKLQWMCETRIQNPIQEAFLLGLGGEINIPRKDQFSFLHELLNNPALVYIDTL